MFTYPCVYCLDNTSGNLGTPLCLDIKQVRQLALHSVYQGCCVRDVVTVTLTGFVTGNEARTHLD